MSIEVKFFASLRDDLGCAHIQFPAPATVASLLQGLEDKFGANAQALTASGVRLALNQTLIEPDELQSVQLNAGDEVAFLPPVTGG